MPAALLMLAVIPLLAGVFRVIQLLGGPEFIPADNRFADGPLPLMIHIAAAATYLVVGAFQFVPRFRRKHRAWHRRAGRGTVPAGRCGDQKLVSGVRQV